MTTRVRVYTQAFAANFKQSYAYTMGGTQTIVLPNGQRFTFDDRAYYKGRGSKYNNGIRHDLKGEVLISPAQVRAAEASERKAKANFREWERQTKAKAKRIREAEKAGVYSIRETESGRYPELTPSEEENRYFDVSRIARTFGISEDDAALLQSRGKTTVVAKTNDGKTLLLYHPDLSCNHLSIHVREATEDELSYFTPAKHREHTSAPFAGWVGQTKSPNHFVC